MLIYADPSYTDMRGISGPSGHRDAYGVVGTVWNGIREPMRGWVDIFGDRLTLRRLMLAVVCLCLCLPAAAVRAGDEDAYAAALRQSEYLAAEIDAALRELDARRYDYDAEYQPPLSYTALSINKNATVTVGGEVRVNYTHSSSNLPSAPFGKDPLTRGHRGNSKIGDLSLTSTHLYFDVAFGQRWRAYFDFNLQGQNQRRHTRYRYRNLSGKGYERIKMNDNLEEAYLEMLKAGHSGLGIKVGQFHLPFGLKAKPDLFMQSYLQSADLSGSYLLGNNGYDGMMQLPHASACLDPVMAAMLSYELRDIIRFEAALFQDADQDSDLRNTWDGRRLKSEQPRSFQVGAGIYPLEDWELSFAFRNRHSRNRGVKAWTNSPYRGDFAGGLASGSRDPRWNGTQWDDSGTGPSFGARRNEQSITAGLAVEIPHTGLSVYGEYAYGWNQGFNKHIRSDDVNLGMAYRVTPRLTLHLQGEWLHVRDGSWLTALTGGGYERDVRNNRLYRFLLGGEYELLSGLTLEAGWQFEYWRYHSSTGNDGDSVTRNWRASTFYMGTRFIF